MPSVYLDLEARADLAPDQTFVVIPAAERNRLATGWSRSVWRSWPACSVDQGMIGRRWRRPPGTERSMLLRYGQEPVGLSLLGWQRIDGFYPLQRLGRSSI